VFPYNVVMLIWLTPAPLSLTPESAGRRAGPVESLIQSFFRSAKKQESSAVSSFFQSKGARDARTARDVEVPLEPTPVGVSPDLVSSVGRGMLVTGNVICPGILQIFGSVTGEIQAASLVICDGGRVDGTIIAQDAVIQGTFKGTIYGNSVKLQHNAVVEGEIFNRSLSIDQDAQFEGVSRRLDRPVDPPPVGEVPEETTVAAPAMQADPIFEPAG
jgi:cytoskeletal protein CcmA (bactofilin family)